MVPINNHEDDGRSSSSSTCLPDGTNPYCWLATMPAPPLDEFGLRMKNTTTKSASLVHLAASVQNSEFALECISCSSPGIEELGHVLKTDEGIRESTNLVNHTLNKLVHMMEGVFMQVQIDRILKKADVGGRCSCTCHNHSYLFWTLAICKAATSAVHVAPSSKDGILTLPRQNVLLARCVGSMLE
jgi:hypothetical protein